MEVPGIYGEIQFMDPWLIDDYSNHLGPRNRGMSADFLSVDYSSNNIGINTQYNGVFLDQDYNIPGNPYYSVKSDASQEITLYTTGNPAGRTHRFYFQNWGGTEVQYENNNALETGVVFTSGNAEATANLKGTQLSNDDDGYTNSQRKFVRTPDGHLHSVYQSMGRVWYERSTDGRHKLGT